MDKNYIGKETDQDDLDLIKEYQLNGKLHPDFLPFTTYDLVQSGYPRPTYGEMISDDWGGTDGEGRLLPSTGMWCKVEDIKKLLKLK